MSRNTTRLFFVLLLAITILILTSSGGAYVSMQELRYNTKYECNGETIVVGHCRSDDDGPGMPRTQPSADYCMVYYPSRPKRGGFTVQETELKSDVMRKLTACNALSPPEPVSVPTTPLANAETPAPGLKHYSRAGLAFDYPADVTLEDKSVTAAQNRETAGQVLYLTHAAGSGADSVAQISIVSRYEMLDTAEQIANARKDMFDAFIDAIIKEVQVKLERSEKQIVVGGKQASGVRLRGMRENRSYSIEVYSLVLGWRPVVLSFEGYDTAIESAASAWEIVRSSLKVQ